MKSLLYILFFTTSFAQIISDYSFTGAKTTAQLGAVVSEQSEVETIFHNPAGIVDIKNNRISIGGGNLYGYSWLPIYYIAGVMPILDLGTIGFSFQQFKTEYGNITLSKENIFSIAQGFHIQKDKNSNLSLGYTANFIQWDLSNSAGISGNGLDGQSLNGIDANVVSIDIGILANLREKYRFGLLVKNITSSAIGNNSSRQILPKRINIGVTYKPINGLFTTIVAERILKNNTIQIKGSIRYKINTLFEIYTGAQLKPNRFGFGCKMLIDKYSLIYSLLTHPILPSTQQISVSFAI